MAIKICDLFHVYNAKTDIENVALNGVSLELEDHFFAALVGKTGSGKSTLAQHLNYLLKPNSGEIYIQDFKISSSKKDSKRSRLSIKSTFTPKPLNIEAYSQPITPAP